MCITQSRRRKSFGLNLAAYTAAYQKEAPTTTSRPLYAHSASTADGLSATLPAPTTNTFVDHNGASFAAVSFPDVVPAVSTPDFEEPELANNNPQKKGAAAARPADELKSLEGKYVQGVYIPPSRPEPKRVRKPQKPGKTAKMHDRHFVQHDYHDHSNEVPEGPQPSSEAVEAAILGKKTGRSVGVGKISFPRKLHFLLDQIERDGLAHVISWLPHGRAFAVHKPKEFTEFVMPKYFNQSKLTSFQRQLNLYGFSRLTRGRDSGGYYHEYFLRGMPFLTKHVARTRVKGTRFKAASNPDAEPNFYAMKLVSLPQIHPLASRAAQQQPALVSGSEESSAVSSRRGSNSSSDSRDSYRLIERALPITSGSFDISLPDNTCFAFSSAQTIATAAAAAPILSTPTKEKVTRSICDLWDDNLNAFEPNPYSPKASPIPNTVAIPTPQSLRVSPIPMLTSSTSIGESLPSPCARPDSSSSSSRDDDEDSILDLLDDWVSGNDEFIDEVVEQAIDNDLDFGHLLDIIAKD